MEICPIGVSGHSYLNAYITVLDMNSIAPVPFYLGSLEKQTTKKEKNYFVRVFIICSQRFFDSIQ